jgi:hypothetical protein
MRGNVYIQSDTVTDTDRFSYLTLIPSQTDTDLRLRQADRESEVNI